MENYCLVPSSPPNFKILLTLANTPEKQLNFSCKALFLIKTRVSLKYFVHDCLWKQFLLLSCSRPFKPIFLTFFVTVRSLSQVNLKLEQLSCRKVLKFILLEKYFSDFFSQQSKFVIERLSNFQVGLGHFLRRIKKKFQQRYYCF